MGLYQTENPISFSYLPILHQAGQFTVSPAGLSTAIDRGGLSLSDALEMLNPEMKGWGIYEHEVYRRHGRTAAGRAAPQTHPSPMGLWLPILAHTTGQIELSRAGSCDRNLYARCPRVA